MLVPREERDKVGDVGRVAAAASAGLILALLLPAAGAAGGATVTNGDRAIASYVAMQRYLFDLRAGRYREQLGGPATAAAWPVSQALAATLAVVSVPNANPEFVRGARARLRMLDRYRSGSTYSVVPGWGDVYLDDNEWLAQDLLDWDALQHDPLARRNAAGIFAAAVHAWDASTADTCPGGVYWTTSVPGLADRNTVSTANGALVGLRLYALTRAPVYLYWSQRMLDWLDTCLLAPNGLYWDHIAADGSIDRTEWSYNQGAVIGALVLLYKTTGDPAALARAEQLADSTLQYLGSRWSTSEPVVFATIFFRDLLTLSDADRNQAYVAAAQAYADNAWQTARHSDTGLFTYDPSTQLLDQAGL